MMYQPKMSRRCLEVLSMPLPESHGNKIKMHDTPATPESTLHANSEGHDRKCNWNYRAVIGILNYIRAMTRPDISFAVHHCARHCNMPKLCHEQEVKRICRYLAGTLDKGLILQPDLSKGFESYVEAAWAGNYRAYIEKPSTAFSRTGYVLYYAGCPIIWGSKLQSIVALSTTEAEYVALSTAPRETITLTNLLTELRDRRISIPFVKPTIRCKIFEDKAAACIKVAKEPKLRPRTKHLAVRLDNFRDHVARGDLTIHHVSTKEQVADLFTKPSLPRDQFTSLRSKLMGW